MGYAQFDALLGFPGSDLDRPKIQDENVLEDGEMHYMYDRAYGDVDYATTSRLIPYYKMLNQLLRFTVTPKADNSDKISNMSRNLLARLGPNQPEFSVFDFIWEEIIICSVSPKKGCHYAPYIFHMITEVTGLDIMTDKSHQVNRPSKGTLDRLLKIGAHAPPTSPDADALSGPADPSLAGHSSSRGPRGASHRALKKKGILKFLSQGLLACFNVAKHNAQEIHAHKKHVDEQLLKIEACQKEIMAKNDIPYSPLRAPMDFPPPPTFYNPWEEMGGPSMMFGAPQAANDSDNDDEDDVPAADTPTNEDGGNGGDDDDEDE